MRKIIINITQRDIDNGIKYSANPTKYPPNCYCPSALALRRHKGFKEAKIGYIYIAVLTSRIPLVSELKQFLNTFDNKRFDKIKPTKITMEIPDGI